MNNKRKSPDRRKWNLVEEKSFPYNRRKHPDRRLNNIIVQWVPLGIIR